MGTDVSSRTSAREHSIAIGHRVIYSYSSRTRTRPLLALLRGRTRLVLEPDRARTRKKWELLVRYPYLVVFLLVHGRVKKTRTRPWTGTGQVRLRERTSTGSARCRRLPEVELAHELELVRGLTTHTRRRHARSAQPTHTPGGQYGGNRTTANTHTRGAAR